MRQARARVIAVDVKAVIEHEAPQATEHHGTAEPLLPKEKDQGDG